MAYSEALVNRVRAALEHFSNVEEKKMFFGKAFMVNEKLLACVGADNVLLRIDPAIHEALVEKQGCRSMMMKGKECIGYVHVYEENLINQNDFDYWINLAISYNPKAKSSKKKK